METRKAKELKKDDKMFISGNFYTVSEIRKDGPQVTIITKGGLTITRNGETPVNIANRETEEPRITDMKTAAGELGKAGIRCPKMTGNKLQETRAKDVKPGDRVRDGILGGDFFTIESISLKEHEVFMTTKTALSIHAQNEEIFLKEITPAEQGEEAAKAQKEKEEYLEERKQREDGEEAAREETAEFLQTAASLEDCEERIKNLKMTIQEHAEEIMNATGKHQDDLMSLHEITIEPEDLDASQFYQDLEEEIGEALNHAKEMNEAAQELSLEIEEKERLEEIIGSGNVS